MANTAQMTDNSVELQHQGIRRRAPRHHPGSSIIEIAPVPVNSKYADPLEASELQELAHVFSRLGCQILAFARDVMELEDQRGAPPENMQACSRLKTTRQALHEVHVGTYQFSVEYLRDVELLAAWVAAGNVHRDLFKSAFDRCIQQEREKIGQSARVFERLAEPLLGALKFAAGSGSLNVVMTCALGEKYIHLDEIVDVLHAQTGEPRDLPTWQEILLELRDVPSRAAVPDVKAAAQNMSTTRISLILWITIFSTVVCGGPMLAYAWNFSDHQPGSWAEENFFFLLQGSIMQVFGLVVTVISLAKNKSVPVAAWALPSVLTLVLAFVSPLLYCFVPKRWSSFCTLVAASIQAFLVLQLALYSA